MGKMGSNDQGSSPMDRIARLGMSPRQQMLNRLWALYRCAGYDNRKLDWNGREHLDPIATEAVASAGAIPPGFYDASGQNVPLKFRRPTAPYALVKVIVDRFTGLLFSERQHPQIHVEGDPATEDFLSAVVEAARFWPSMIHARQYGGSMGTVVVGFQFIDGKPVVEVHDPRWIWPTFVDRQALVLESIEKRYMFPVEERDPKTGRYETVWYWYRRIVDQNTDILFEPAPVGKGEEPNWVVKVEVAHELGFCPAIWVQNLPMQDDIDGDADCVGVFEVIEAIDTMLSQVNKGILNNCDPTLGLVTDAEMGMEIKKGSDNSIKIPNGGTMQYLEMQGTGLKIGLDMVETLRKYALEVAQCVVENPDSQTPTATEVLRRYTMMLSKADMMREQYGEKCVKPLLMMILTAALKLNKGVATDGAIVRQVLKLPPKVVSSPDGTLVSTPRAPGPDAVNAVVKLMWPAYFEPTMSDVLAAAQAAGAAKLAQLIDAEHAVKFTAEYFGVEDVQAVLAKIKDEASSQQADMEAMALGASGVSPAGGSKMQIPAPKPPSMPK